MVVGTHAVVPQVSGVTIQKHAVHRRPGVRLSGRPAREVDRLQVMLGRPHPASAPDDVVAAGPPSGRILERCNETSISGECICFKMDKIGREIL